MTLTSKIASALAVIALWGWHNAAAPAAEKASSSREVVRPAAEMKFKEEIPGVWKAVLWGDPYER